MKKSGSQKVQISTECEMVKRTKKEKKKERDNRINSCSIQTLIWLIVIYHSKTFYKPSETFHKNTNWLLIEKIYI